MPRTGVHHYTAYDKAHRDDTADRMAARRLMIRTYAAKHGETLEQATRKWANMDVDHIKAIKGGGSGRALSNLRFRDPHANRADKTY